MQFFFVVAWWYRSSMANPVAPTKDPTLTGVRPMDSLLFPVDQQGDDPHGCRVGQIPNVLASSCTLHSNPTDVFEYSVCMPDRSRCYSGRMASCDGSACMDKVKAEMIQTAKVMRKEMGPVPNDQLLVSYFKVM